MCIDEYNEDLLDILDELRQQPFFRYYSVDLLKGCNYFPQQEDECESQACELYPADPGVVPESIIAVDGDEHEFELDAWVRWDMPSEDYYDVFENREQYTGYDGSKIWRFVHEKICFPKENFNNKLGSTEGAVWQRDFNRAVSGLHSSINAHIIQGMVDGSGGAGGQGESAPDPAVEYARRLSRGGENPAALDHLYFGYMLMLCAVREAATRLEACDFGDDTGGDPAGVRALVDEMLASPLLNNAGILVAESNLRRHATEEGAASRLWQARLRTRDLMRIMDCVQCNVCRLHGKVGSLGVATAMQVLLGAEGRGGDSSRLHRVEIAALISTLGKFAHAVQIVQEFEATDGNI